MRIKKTQGRSAGQTERKDIMRKKKLFTGAVALLAAGTLLAGTALAAPVADVAEIGGTFDEDSRYVEYVITEADAKDTVILNGDAMYLAMLGQAWVKEDGKQPMVPGVNLRGRMRITNQSGETYKVTDFTFKGLPDSVLAELAGQPNGGYPPDEAFYGLGGEKIPLDYLPNRTASKALADLWGLSSYSKLTFAQLAGAEERIAQVFAEHNAKDPEAQVKTYGDYLYWYVKENRPELLGGATKFSELPVNALLWLNHDSNAGVKATGAEINEVMAKYPKAGIYGYRSGSRVQMHEWDKEVAEVYYAVQWKDLISFTFDDARYPTHLEKGVGEVVTPGTSLYDQSRKAPEAQAMFDAVLGGKELSDGQALALDELMYHIHTKMNNDHQDIAVSFMFTITLEKVKTPYNVHYHANGGTGAQSDLDGHFAEATVGVKDKGTMTREGYTFTGWNTQADGKGTAYAPGASFAMPKGDVHLYAQWQEELIDIPDEEIPLDPGGKDPEPTVPTPPTPVRPVPSRPITNKPGQNTPGLIIIDDDEIPLSPGTSDSGMLGLTGLLVLAAGAGMIVLGKKRHDR